jgi:hypothetical protein
MQETQQSTKLRGHIDQLQQVHDDLDKQIEEDIKNYKEDRLVIALKKRKLQLKDEIRYYQKELEDLG